MGILGNILGKLFPSSHAANAPASPSDSGAGMSAPTGAASSPQAPTSTAASATSQPQPSMSQVDVAQMLDDKAANHGEKLNWKTSIVDLLKLLDIDSSLTARKELAKELNYSGDTNDSASMNMWLHRQVMNKVAANGGKVPADLQD